MFTDRRGVSEVLGFVLIFSLIVTTVGIVYVYGVGSLKGARDVEQVNNAERAFDVLASNVEDIVWRRAPSRGTEVKLQDATLRMGDPVVVNVTGHRVGDPNDNFSVEYDVHPVVYETGGDDLVYVDGAVIREQADGSVLVDRPDMLFSERQVNVVVVQTRPLDTTPVAGSTTALIRIKRSLRDVSVARTSGSYEATVNVTTPRASVWRTYLEDQPGVTCPPAQQSATRASCTVSNADEFYVTVVRLDVSFA